ncbi:Na-translocating system protein MpsC family protein [Bacillus sp. FJAT-29814]|uniref:Na-translocating system protein MpsC family protein n=1 Tax=Bacillus sp. FJAT-29814 TaxID=1729688 RepID=UPI000B25C6CA|nr:Na-translocating system protein MpsC family protein [Bacillus sp. FJAT-29814]
MEKKQVQMELASYIGRTLRENFGKGPESVFVSLGDSILTVYLRNFSTPMENVLLGQKQDMLVQRTRDILMGTLIPEFKAYIKVLTGVEVKEFYYDWSLQNNSGVFVCIGSNFNDRDFDEDFQGKQAVEEEIRLISIQAQKEPDKIFSFRLNDRTLVVFRKGILVPIEKELIMLGNSEALKLAKRNLEKRLLHNKRTFEGILQSKVVDIFVDWDFQLDKSAIVLILSPTA